MERRGNARCKCGSVGRDAGHDEKVILGCGEGAGMHV